MCAPASTVTRDAGATRPAAISTTRCAVSAPPGIEMRAR